MKTLPTVPRIAIELDGKTFSQGALRHLEEVVVSRRLSQPGMCEISLVMPDPSPWPEIGMDLRVSLADSGDLLFAGEVAAVEFNRRSSGERLLFVRAYDALLQLRRQHHIRAWPVSSAGSIALELTSGLWSTVTGGPGPTFPSLIQAEENDFDFLAGVAERSGLYLALRGDVLELVSLEGVGDEIMLEIDKALLEISVEANATFACDGVKSYGWDASRVERHVAEASKLSSNDAEDPSGSGMVLLSNGNASAQDVAQASAQAELHRRIARSRTARGTAEGSLALMPGSRIRVKGLPATLPDSFTLIEVTHRIETQSGFVTTFSSTPPECRQRPDSASVAWGVVTSIHDPEQMGRVRVSLPAMDDVETEWMEVLAIGAGSGKGFVNLPDRGDKVVVLFPRGDLGSGLILGGLYGTEGPGDYGVEDKIVRYALLTPGGSKLRFDDSRKSLRVEDVTGSYMEFTPGGATLHAAVDLRVEAPGRTMTISAKQIDFRRS